jgi:hypothetical protein
MSMTGDESLAVTRLLADPSLWVEPRASLADAVVAAVVAERDAPPVVVTPVAAAVATVASRRHWPTHVAAGLLGAAAATVIAIAVTHTSDDTSDQVADVAAATVQLQGTDLAAGFTGTADVTTEQSGVLIRLRVPGLPRREGTDFYEGWLKSCDGSGLVPIGTFHDMDRAAGWAGVAVTDYPLLTVTAERAAGPNDPDQGSSGQVVVTGVIGPCPAP